MREGKGSSRSQPVLAPKSATRETEPSGAFTPGPWCVTTCLDYWVQSDVNGEPVAHCGDVSWSECDRKQAMWEANACLIAAAPDLLAALRNCPLPDSSKSPAEFYRRFYDWHRGARAAAIAKAEGRQ